MSITTKKSMKIKVVRKTYTVQLRWLTYQVDNRPGLELIDAGDDAMSLGERVTMASVNLPEVPLAEGEIFIKTWSMNEGVLEQLIAAGVLSDPIELVPTGFTNAARCKILSREPV